MATLPVAATWYATPDSIVMAASMITAAWEKAGRPALPVEAPRLPRKVRR